MYADFLIKGVGADGIEAEALGDAVLKGGDDAGLHSDFVEVAEHFFKLIARDFIVVGGDLAYIGGSVGLGHRGGWGGWGGTRGIGVDVFSLAVVDDDDSVALNVDNGSALNRIADGEA